MKIRFLAAWQGSIRLRLATMTAVAFTIWCTWAFYANADHGMVPATIAGLAQGLQSALSTFFGSAFIEWLYSKLKDRKHAVPLITAISTSSSFLFMFSVHYLLGTPEILLTIAPVNLMALIYCFSYTASLTRPAAAT